MKGRHEVYSIAFPKKRIKVGAWCKSGHFLLQKGCLRFSV